MNLKKRDCGSIYINNLAEGCVHCTNGSKMVLLITGKCDVGCFYCPLSAEKLGKDVMYANERFVKSYDEIIEEAECMDATGTGITGGDPLLVLDRTVEIITLLKKHFGNEHHIHLYTSHIDFEKVLMLKKSGLDEIRFHPSVDTWNQMHQTDLENIILNIDIDVGIEIPAIPGKEKELEELIVYSANAGVKFINLNELEFSETNWGMIKEHNFDLKNDTSASIAGSEELVIKLMKKHKKLPIHFCSSTFKDGAQLRRRLIRRGNHIAKKYDIVTDDGTILKGIVCADNLDEVFKSLIEKYDIPYELIFIDLEMNRIEIASWILNEISNEIPYKCYIVEEYPTFDRMEVERTPLN